MGQLSRSASQDTLDDRAAHIGDLISELPQAQSLLADPQAIELHELGLVELPAIRAQSASRLYGGRPGRMATGTIAPPAG
jgi:hypothetical protein